MLAEAEGIFYDGTTPRPHAVRVVVDRARLQIIEEGQPIADWPVGNVRRVPTPSGLRLAVVDTGARLDVNPAFVGSLSEALGRPRELGAPDGGMVARLVVWAVAAVAVLAATVIWGIPFLARIAAPLVPVAAEQQLGITARAQVLSMLTKRGEADLCEGRAGRAALARLVEPLAAAAGAHLPVRVELVRSDVANALALPGGQILVLSSLADKVATADELAGVIAHELGHVVHRDGLRRVGEAAGLALVFGFVLGDFAGSTVAIAVGQALVSASYGRAVESEADAFAIDLMARVGRDPAALADALDRLIPKDGAPPLAWLASHPAPQARMDAIRQRAAEARRAPRPAGPAPADELALIRSACR